MNKKGIFYILKFIFLLIIAVMLWALWLGGFLNSYAQQYIVSSGATGIEAFILSNLNLFFLFGLVLSAFIVVYFGGGE